MPILHDNCDWHEEYERIQSEFLVILYKFLKKQKMKILKLLGILILYSIIYSVSELIFGKNNILMLFVIGIPFIFVFFVTLVGDSKK